MYWERETEAIRGEVNALVANDYSGVGQGVWETSVKDYSLNHYVCGQRPPGQITVSPGYQSYKGNLMGKKEGSWMGRYLAYLVFLSWLHMKITWGSFEKYQLQV